MANVVLMDLCVLFLIGQSAAFTNCCSSLREDASQEGQIDAVQPSVPSRSSAVKFTSFPGPSNAGGPTCVLCDLSGARRRVKRCSCYSFRDKECTYYCHLGIIWIRTPDFGRRIVPYGMSSYRGSRRNRRSALASGPTHTSSPRCVCAHLQDSKCWTFCEERGDSP